MNKAIFLDRDGTINIDPGYLDTPDKLVLFPGVEQALQKFKKAGYRLFVVTNQSGIGRKLFTESTLNEIHQKLNQILSAHQAEIDHFYHSPFLPDTDSPLRKPNPGMLLQAQKDYQIDLSQSYMIGDRTTDLQAGHHAGCRGSLLVKTGYGEKTAEKILKGKSKAKADYIGETLNDIANWVIEIDNLETKRV